MKANTLTRLYYECVGINQGIVWGIDFINDIVWGLGPLSDDILGMRALNYNYLLIRAPTMTPFKVQGCKNNTVCWSGALEI